MPFYGGRSGLSRAADFARRFPLYGVTGLAKIRMDAVVCERGGPQAMESF